MLWLAFLFIAGIKNRETIMSFIVGKKEIKREIKFDAEGDLGELVPSMFVVTVERPTKPVSKEFSLLFAEFSDVLSAVKNREADEAFSAVRFTQDLDAVEQKLSDFVKGKIAGWDHVMDVNNAPVPFSSENLDQVFADKDARRAIFEDYQQLVSGRRKDAEKNSEKQEGAG